MTRALVGCGLVAATLIACDNTRKPPQIGQQAPRYTAASLTGDAVATSDLAGKVVLLNVWATWCAPCREEIPYLQTLYDSLGTQGLTIVGVSVDARGNDETIQGFVKDFKMTYPIWRDPDETIQSLYLALGVPASYLIDRRGVLRWRHLGIVRPTDTTFVRALTDALATAP